VGEPEGDHQQDAIDDLEKLEVELFFAAKHLERARGREVTSKDSRAGGGEAFMGG
jgi:hypothetical protein